MSVIDKIDQLLNDGAVMNETKVATGDDMVNVGTNVMDVPSNFKPENPSKKTIKVGDDIYLAGSYGRWGNVEGVMPNKVKINMNPGMGNRPNIVTVKYDQVIAWKYKNEYSYVNKNRMI